MPGHNFYIELLTIECVNIRGLKIERLQSRAHNKGTGKKKIELSNMELLASNYDHNFVV